jgi:lipopolysaccharide export system permease protein
MDAKTRMSILQRYIAKMVISASALVVLVMTALIFVFGLLDELRDVGTGDYGFLQALLHVIYILPHNLYQYFPMLVLISGVIGLGILASHQELVVMRTAGFSVSKIAMSLFLAALLLIFFATGIGEWLGPLGFYTAVSHKQSEENGGQAVATLSGVWIHEGNNFLHISRVIGTSELEGVTRYEFDDQHRLLSAYYVKTLERDHKKWLAHDAVKTTFENNKTHSEPLAQNQWDLALNPNLLSVGLVEPPEMSLLALQQYSRHLIKNGLQAGEFQWEFWKRIFQPLTTLVMILLAIPFVLRSSRSVTMGWRIMLGITVGFTFYILNGFLGQFSIVFQVSPLFAALIPILMFGMLGFVLVLRTRN